MGFTRAQGRLLKHAVENIGGGAGGDTTQTDNLESALLTASSEINGGSNATLVAGPALLWGFQVSRADAAGDSSPYLADGSAVADRKISLGGYKNGELNGESIQSRTLMFRAPILFSTAIFFQHDSDTALFTYSLFYTAG